MQSSENLGIFDCWMLRTQVLGTCQLLDFKALINYRSKMTWFNSEVLLGAWPLLGHWGTKISHWRHLGKMERKHIYDFWPVSLQGQVRMTTTWVFHSLNLTLLFSQTRSAVYFVGLLGELSNTEKVCVFLRLKGKKCRQKLMSKSLY